jgi:hypothetical protein
MVPTVRVKLVLSVVLFASSAIADLQLTPEVTEYNLDGVRLRQLVFADSEQRVTYTPPRGWHHSGSGDGLQLQPPRNPDAQAFISVTKLTEPQVLDESTMKRLSDEVIASLPGAATHAVIVSQQKNPLLIERKETFLVIINYDCYGTSYARSVMFLNRKREQLRFQLTSPRLSFAPLQKEFLGSQFSWQNL